MKRRQKRCRRPLSHELLETRWTLNGDWSNPLNPLDADNNGLVSPLDVLLSINELNSPRIIGSRGELPDRSLFPSAPYFDSNADEYLTTIDILLGVNSINDDRGPPNVSVELEHDTGIAESGGDTDHVTSDATLVGTVRDALTGVAVLEAKIDGGSSARIVFDRQGNFRFDPSLRRDGSQDGFHRIEITATDAVGNVSGVAVAEFVFDTQAPALTLDAPSEGADVLYGSQIDGRIDGTGSALVLLTYSLDDGVPIPISFSSEGGPFRQTVSLAHVVSGDHRIVIHARDSAGNSTSITRNVHVPMNVPLRMENFSPNDLSDEVATTIRPQVFFSQPVDSATLTSTNFFLTDASGSPLPATIVASSDKTFASLVMQSPLPGSTRITVHVNGDEILAASDRTPLDADHNGTPGGEFTYSFTTASTALLNGTRLIGTIADPGPDLTPGTSDDVRPGPDGQLHTDDDEYLLPMEGVEVRLVGVEHWWVNTVRTDALGQFQFDAVPGGIVSLAIDGRTATNRPSGVMFLETDFGLRIRPGQVNTIRAALEPDPQRALQKTDRGVYLPRLPADFFQSVAPSGTTIISPDADSAPALTPEQRAQLTIAFQPNGLVNSKGEPIARGRVGLGTISPEVASDFLPPELLDSTFVFNVEAIDTVMFASRARMTFPNLFNGVPRTKYNLVSLGTAPGKTVFEGTVTVAADGKSATTDPGVGVTEPGWYGLTPSVSWSHIRKANVTSDSTLLSSGGIGVDPRIYFAISNTNAGGTIFGVSDPAGNMDTFLTPDSTMDAVFYQPATNRWATLTFDTDLSGAPTDLGQVYLSQIGGPDSDADGIPDIGETAIGSDAMKIDSDGDGITDTIELAQGTDLLDGQAIGVGVVSGVKLNRSANKVVVVGGNSIDQRQLAYVETGNEGLAIVDTTKPSRPVILSQIALSEYPVDNDIAVDPYDRIVAAVSLDRGLTLIDVSDSTRSKIVRTVDSSAFRVEYVDGLFYSISQYEIRAHSPFSGEVVRSLAISVRDVTHEGRMLYAIDNNGTIFAIDVSNGQMRLRGSVPNPGPGRTGQLAVVNGKAYVLGAMVADVSDPDHLRLIDDKSNFIESHIIQGITFSANNSTGLLELVSQAPIDVNRVPPRVTIGVSAEDVDASLPGVQVIRDTSIQVWPDIENLSRIRTVELIVNGEVVQTAVSAPFDFGFQANGLTGKAYDVQVRATDTGGYSAVSNVVKISVGVDRAPPSIMQIVPNDGATRGTGLRHAIIEFSEPIDPETVKDESFHLRDSRGVVVSGVTANVGDDPDTVRLSFGELAPGNYTMEVDAFRISDVAGNHLGETILMSHFAISAGLVAWNNNNGGFWDDPNNWDSGVVPGPDDNVIIDVPGDPPIVLRSGDIEIHSLTSRNNFIMTGGTLTASEGVRFRKRFDFFGGVVRDTTIDPMEAGAIVQVRPSISSFYQDFDGVTLNTDLAIEGWASLLVQNGLVLNSRIQLSSAIYGRAELLFSNTTGIEGTGSIAFVGDWGNNFIQIDSADPTSTFVIGPGIRIGGTQNGTLGISRGKLVNRGVIEATSPNQTITIRSTCCGLLNSGNNEGVMSATSGGALELYGMTNSANISAIDGGTLSLDGTWNNSGTLTIDRGTLNLGGYIRPDDIGRIESNNASINIVGEIDNIGNTLTLDGSAGTWQFRGGAVRGGTVKAIGGAVLYVDIPIASTADHPPVFNDVILETGVVLRENAELVLKGDWENRHEIIASGGVLTLQSHPEQLGMLSLENARLQIGASFTTSEIKSVATPTTTVRVIQGGIVDNSGDAITLDPNETVWQARGGIIRGGVISSAPNNSFVVSYETYGDSVTFEGVTINGTVMVTANGSLRIRNDLELNGQIVVDHGEIICTGAQTITGAGQIIVSGALQVQEGNERDGHHLTISPGITIRAGHGGLTFDGHDLENQGTIIADGENISINLSSDAIFRNLGTIQAENGARLVVNDDWSNYGLISIKDSLLTLGGTWSNHGLVQTENSSVFLDGTQRLTDLGELRTKNGTVVVTGDIDLEHRTLLLDDSTGGWTLKGATLRNGQIKTLGSARLAIADREMATLDGIVLNTDLAVPMGSTLTLTGSWANHGTLTSTDATVKLIGYVTPEILGDFRRTGGYVTLFGEYDNTGRTLVLGDPTNPWSFGYDAVIRGGTIRANGKSLSDVILDGVVLDGDLTVNGRLTIRHDFVLNSKLTVAGTIQSEGYVGITGAHGQVVLNGGGIGIGEAPHERPVLTIGNGISLIARGNSRIGGGWLVNKGLISINGKRDTLTINVARMENDSTIKIQNGGELTVYNLDDAQRINVEPGSTFRLYGQWRNKGILTASDATLVLGGTWTNTGRIRTFNATVELGGASMTLSTIGVFEHVGGTIRALAPIDLMGTTLTLDDGAGAWVVRNGGLSNGTISATGSASLLVEPFSTATFVNLTLDADVEVSDGSELTLLGQWRNEGTLSANYANVNLGGTFTLASLGQFRRTGGNVSVIGDFYITGQTLLLDDTTGTWNLAYSGAIINGTIRTEGSAKLSANGGTLDRITLNTDLDLTGGLAIKNGLVLNGEIRAHGGTVAVQGTQSITGQAGSIALGGGVLLFQRETPYEDDIQRTLTIGSGISISGGKRGRIETSFSKGVLINEGTIEAVGPNESLSILAYSVHNEGTMSARDGGHLLVNNIEDATGLSIVDGGTVQLDGSWTNTGDISFSDGTLILSGHGTNAGRISSLDGTLMLSGDWTNTGSIVSSNSTLDLGGNINLRAIGTIVREEGEVHVSGTIDLDGGTLSLDDTTGSWLMDNGTLRNGTVITSGSASLLVASHSTASLDAITLDGNLSLIDSELSLIGGWHINGAFSAIDSTVNLGGTFRWEDLGSFSPTGGVVNLIGTLENTGRTLRFDKDAGLLRLANHGIIDHGTITVDGGGTLMATGGTLRGVTLNADVTVTGELVIAEGLELNGTVNLNGGRLTFLGTQTMSGTPARINMNGGSVRVSNDRESTSSPIVTLDSGVTLSATGGGTMIGSFRNKGMIVADGPGKTLTSYGGRIQNTGIFIARNGANVVLSDVDNEAELSVTERGTLTLNYAWENTSVLRAVGATLLLTGSGTNRGIIKLVDSTFDLGDGILLSHLGTIERQGGTVNIVGQVNLEGQTLTLDNQTGNWVLRGGTLDNGTITTLGNTALTIAAGTSATLRSIVLNTDLVVPARSGLVLDGYWVNHGLMTSNGAAIYLGGEFTVEKLGNFHRNGGSVDIVGTLDNSNNTLVLDDTTGNWNLRNGTIRGGSVSTVGNAVLVSLGGSLDAVHMLGQIVVRRDELLIASDLALDGAIVLDGGTLQTYSGTYITGTGQINVVGGGPSNITLYREPNTYQRYSRLSVGSHILIDCRQDLIVKGHVNVNPILELDGTVIVDRLGHSVRFESTDVINHGLMEARSGTIHVVGHFDNSGTLAAGAFGLATIDGDVTLEESGQLRTTLSINPNLGRIEVSGSIQLDGSLDVQPAERFTPSVDEEYKVLQFGESHGDFSTITGLVVPTGVLNLNYNEHSLTITSSDQAPKITSYVPDVQLVGESLDALEVHFSEPLALDTVNSNNFVLFKDGAVIAPSAFDVLSDGRQVKVTFANQTSGDYEFVIHGANVLDRSGNAISTGDLRRPISVRQFTGIWRSPQGGNWNDPWNWERDAIPGPYDSVYIKTNPGAVVRYSDADGKSRIRSLRTETPFIIAGGELRVERTFSVADVVTIDGGILSDSTVAFSDNGRLEAGENLDSRLERVGVLGDIYLNSDSAKLFVDRDTTYDVIHLSGWNTTLTLGKDTVVNGEIRVEGSGQYSHTIELAHNDALIIGANGALVSAEDLGGKLIFGDHVTLLENRGQILSKSTTRSLGISVPIVNLGRIDANNPDGIELDNFWGRQNLFRNDGLISIAPSSHVSTTFEFTQSSTGTIRIGIGTSEHRPTGFLSVRAPAKLAGELLVDFSDDIEVHDGVRFSFMSFETVNGAFATFEGINTPPGKALELSYEPNKISVRISSALRAESRGASEVSPEDVSIQSLNAILAAALRDWQFYGIAPSQLEAIHGIQIAWVDLPQDVIGVAEANTILLDRNAAGWGWFVDSSPNDDDSFAATARENVFAAMAGSDAENRIDLLTAIEHEVGHLLGQRHSSGVMEATIGPGIRKRARPSPP